MKTHLQKITYQKGFTLIETLFAILIFSAALISLLAIAGKGIVATGQVKNETVAFYLAQEGIEVARNFRDSNFVAEEAWDLGFASTPDCSIAMGCYLDFSSGGVPLLVENHGADEVFFNLGMYTNQDGNQGGTPTGFHRYVRLVPIANGGTPDEYTVTSTVWWQSRGVKRKVELTTLMKKWQ